MTCNINISKELLKSCKLQVIKNDQRVAYIKTQIIAFLLYLKFIGFYRVLWDFIGFYRVRHDRWGNFVFYS